MTTDPRYLGAIQWWERKRLHYNLAIFSIVFIFCFSLFSCKKEKKIQSPSFDQKEIYEKDSTTLSLKAIDTAKFRFQQLDTFNLLNLNWRNMGSYYPILTKEEVALLFDNDQSTLGAYYEGSHHFYSLQKNTSETTVMTILENEASCCTFLHLLSFDQNHQLVSNAIIAGTGGDGGWVHNSYGHFINDSTYIMTSVDYNHELTSTDVIPTYTIDSMITEHHYTKELQFKTIVKEVFKDTIREVTK